MHPGVIIAGKYRVEHTLGRGGMGVVVAATHLHLGTRVALKFLNEGVTKDPKVVQRFLREARATASLKNDHICRVSDFGVEGDVPYIVMELLEGTDLAKVVKVQPLDMATAAEYVTQTCTGLAEAHAARIIHRDLKPGNLFVTRRPNGAVLIKVLDFGVAKAPDGGDFSLTQTSSVVGSPGFMAPEQLRSSRQVDQRSDVWSLGVILYKLTSGRQPFKADALTDLAIAIAMDPVPPLPEVSPAFAAVVMHCLEKDPDRRFQSVQELALALQAFTLESRPTAAFTIDESMAFQSGAGPQPVAPITYAPEPPTTLQGASSQVGPAPRRPRRSRGFVIGLSACVALSIGIVIAVGVTGGRAPAAVEGRPLVPAMQPVVVPPPPPVVVAPPPPPPIEVIPEVAKPVVKKPRPIAPKKLPPPVKKDDDFSSKRI